MKRKLTRQFLDGFRPDAREEVYDSVVSGLLARIGPTGAGTWFVRYRGPDGRLARHKLGTVAVLTPDDARRLARVALGQVAGGVDPRKQRRAAGLTLGRWLKQHYEPWITQERKTGAQMVGDIRRAFPALLGRRLDRISRWDLDKWRAERLKVRKAASANRPVAYLRAALNKALEWGHIETNPLARYRLTREDSSKVRYLDPDEEQRLMAALDAREARIREERQTANAWRRERGYPAMQDLSTTAFADHIKPMVLVSLNTGIRRGELFSLEWRDVSFEQRTLTVRAEVAKSTKARHVPLNGIAYAALAGWREMTTGDCLVFTSPLTGGRFEHVNRAWHGVLKAAQVTGFLWHDQRHHFASMLAMRGAALTVIRDLLGHSDFKTTLRYAHLSPAARADAVALLDAPGNVIPLTKPETAEGTR